MRNAVFLFLLHFWPTFFLRGQILFFFLQIEEKNQVSKRVKNLKKKKKKNLKKNAMKSSF